MSLVGVSELFEAHNKSIHRQLLVSEKLEQWDRLQNFLAMNPDVAERYAVHQTYEILKDDNGK